MKGAAATGSQLSNFTASTSNQTITYGSSSSMSGGAYVVSDITGSGFVRGVSVTVGQRQLHDLNLTDVDHGLLHGRLSTGPGARASLSRATPQTRRRPSTCPGRLRPAVRRATRFSGLRRSVGLFRLWQQASPGRPTSTARAVPAPNTHTRSPASMAWERERIRAGRELHRPLGSRQPGRHGRIGLTNQCQLVRASLGSTVSVVQYTLNRQTNGGSFSTIYTGSTASYSDTGLCRHDVRLRS